MTAADLVVVTTNVFAGNRDIGGLRGQLRRLHPHVIGAQEAQNLGQITGYVRYAAPREASKRAREVPIYLRNDVAQGYRGHEIDQVTKNLGTRVGPDRWLTEVAFRWGGDLWAHLNTHADAAVRGDGVGPLEEGKRAEQNARLTEYVLERIRELHKTGHLVTTSADWNAGPANTGPGTPRWLHERAQMGYRSFGKLDGIGYDERLRLLKSDERRAPGSDHPMGICWLATR